MTFIKSIAAAAALISIASTVQAQDSGAYGNIGVEAFDFEGASGNIVGRIGYNVNAFFAVEAEGAVGVIEDEDDFKIDYKIGAFGRAKLPLGDHFEFFGRLGYYYGESEYVDGDDIAYGGGAEYFFSPEKRHSIRLDYTALESEFNSRIDVYALTYGIAF